MEPGAASAKYVGGQLEATAAAAAVRPRGHCLPAARMVRVCDLEGGARGGPV